MASLELEGVSFRAGGRDILRDVSVSVWPGETLGILGPSGSGKTTLLRVVAGLERATNGTVRFDGEDIGGLPPHRRGFGLMFQDHALFPHLTVGRNVEFGLRAADWDGERRRRRVAELLALVGLGGFERRTIERLSGGERQRVALARALAPSPRLLMLDEPLASLDRGLRERLAKELRDILGSIDIPVLYVTHDQFEAFALAQRVAIMDRGRIARVGSPTEIWDDPRTEFLARFFGMENIVSGQRGADGWVSTEVGSFGPIPGPPGKVRLLLRDDGPELVDASGSNVASAEVRTSAFRGSTSLLTVARGLEELEFAFPAGMKLPDVGETAHVRVPRIQEVEHTSESPEATPPL